VTSLIRRNPLVAYFVIAFGLTWALQIPALLIAEGNNQSLTNDENLRHLLDLFRGRLSGSETSAFLLFILGAGPLVAAIVVLSATAGRTGLRDLWKRSTNWAVGGRWYVIVLGLPVALAAVSLLAGLITGTLDLDSYEALLPASHFLPFLLYMLVFTGIYEEPGWRGFALPYLQRDNTAIRASWILGILWGVWHFPVIIYYNLTVTEVAPPVLIPILAGLVMGTVGWTIVNTWIYNSTESVLLMILLHGWYNTVNAFVVLPFENMTVATVNAVLPWAVAVFVSKRHGDEHLTDGQRPRLELQEAV
jgi:uncharacterized protein